MILRFYYLFIIIFQFYIPSNGFVIGFLDSDIFQNVITRLTIPSNYTLNLVTFQSPSITNIQSYTNAITTLNLYDVIIGKFNYDVSSICKLLNLSYYILNENLRQWTNPFLDSSVDPENYGQVTEIYHRFLSPTSLRMITDSSSYATSILEFMHNLTRQQCNLFPSVTDAQIANCYKTSFKPNTFNDLYVIVTNDSNINLLERFYIQLLHQSLHFRARVLFISYFADPILVKYRLSGATLESVKFFQTLNNATYGDILNERAVATTNFIFIALKDYQKINKSYIQYPNGALFNYSKSIILEALLKRPSLTVRPNLKQYVFYTADKTAQEATQAYAFTFDTGIWRQIVFLQPQVIRVLFISDKIFSVEIRGSDNVVSTVGYFSDMLANLFPPIGLSFTLVDGGSIIGRRIAPDNYTGILGGLFDNSGDISSIPLPVISSYGATFLYSEKIYDLRYSFLIKKAKKPLDFLKFVKPYSILVWVMIIVTIVVLGIILWLTNIISPNESQDTEKMTLPNCLFLVFGSFLIAKMLVKPNIFSTRAFYILIWLGTLFLIVSYVANVTVMITFETNQFNTFTTFDKLLIDKQNYKFVFVPNSYLVDSILTEIEQNVTVQSTFRKLYEYARNKYPSDYLLNTSINVEKYLMNNENVGIIDDEFHNMYYSLRNCDLTTIIDDTYVVSHAYTMRNDFKYVQQLAQRIIVMRESGIINNLENKYFRLGKCTTDVKIVSSISPLALEDMSGIFILIAFGLVICLIISVLEFIYKKIQLKCQRKMTGNSLIFGKIYTAKVTALDKKGVYVNIHSGVCCGGDGEIYYIHKNNLIGRKTHKNQEAPSPSDSGIMIGTKLFIRYLGNSPIDSKRKFEQVNK